jgi:hypothetical protein
MIGIKELQLSIIIVGLISSFYGFRIEANLIGLEFK